MTITSNFDNSLKREEYQYLGEIIEDKLKSLRKQFEYCENQDLINRAATKSYKEFLEASQKKCQAETALLCEIRMKLENQEFLLPKD
jgi:hypothetical protein